MAGFTIPQIYGQIEYLEKNLLLVKKAVSDVVEKENGTKKELYGSLPESDLKFSDFKQLRKNLSTSWINKWTT